MAQTTLPDHLALAIDAHTDYSAFFFFFVDLGRDSPDVSHLRDKAWTFARHIGLRYPEHDMPVLFDGTSDLMEAWQDGREEAEAPLREEAARQRALELERLVVARNWAALRLPSPAELANDLIANHRTCVAGHSLHYEPEAEVIWFTNPYGQDGVLGPAPEIPLLEEFLIDMAHGHDYGPVPY